MPHAIVFYNDCFNVNFQIADDALVMELRDSIRIYEEAAKTKQTEATKATEATEATEALKAAESDGNAESDKRAKA